MKILLGIFLLSANAFAGECCTGSCWTTGCCDPRQRCPSQNEQIYECVNIKNSHDIIQVIKANGTLREKKDITTSSGL